MPDLVVTIPFPLSHPFGTYTGCHSFSNVKTDTAGKHAVKLCVDTFAIGNEGWVSVGVKGVKSAGSLFWEGALCSLLKLHMAAVGYLTIQVGVGGEDVVP